MKFQTLETHRMVPVQLLQLHTARKCGALQYDRVVHAAQALPSQGRVHIAGRQVHTWQGGVGRKCGTICMRSMESGVYCIYAAGSSCPAACPRCWRTGPHLAGSRCGRRCVGKCEECGCVVHVAQALPAQKRVHIADRLVHPHPHPRKHCKTLRCGIGVRATHCVAQHCRASLPPAFAQAMVQQHQALKPMPIPTPHTPRRKYYGAATIGRAKASCVRSRQRRAAESMPQIPLPHPYPHLMDPSCLRRPSSP